MILFLKNICVVCIYECVGIGNSLGDYIEI